MSMTETRPASDAAAASPATDVPPPPPEPAGLAGWFSTADHKRIGRLFLATSLLFLIGGSVLGAVLGAERIDGLTIFEGTTFAQAHTLHGEVAILLFLVPFFLGLGTYLVPLQVGAPDIAFARGSATAYWTYLFAGLVLIGAYVADGGIAGGDPVAVNLYLLSLVALSGATVLALVSILTTIVTQRAPGMTIGRTPYLTFSFLVGGGLTLLATPVLVARLMELFLAHRGAELTADTYGSISWFWSVPSIYLLTVPVIGVALEVAATMAGVRHRSYGIGLGVIAAAGILSFGAFAQTEAGREGIGSIVYVGLAIGSLLVVLAVLGLVGDTVRRGQLAFRAPMLLALGAVAHLFLGALAGAVLVIEPLDLDGTVWAAAQLHFTLYGGAVLGAFAALWFWAPKIWGVELGELAGKAVFALTFLGGFLLAAPDLVSGLVDAQPLQATEVESDLSAVLNIVSLVGGVLAVLGVLVAVAAVVGRARRGPSGSLADDPWGRGHTLEWATSSPPPRSNFLDTVPSVSSPTPVLDARTGTPEVTP